MSNSVLPDMLIISLVVFIALLMIGCESAGEDIIPEEKLKISISRMMMNKAGKNLHQTEAEINITADNSFLYKALISFEYLKVSQCCRICLPGEESSSMDDL